MGSTAAEKVLRHCARVSRSFADLNASQYRENPSLGVHTAAATEELFQKDTVTKKELENYQTKSQNSLQSNSLLLDDNMNWKIIATEIVIGIMTAFVALAIKVFHPKVSGAETSLFSLPALRRKAEFQQKSKLQSAITSLTIANTKTEKNTQHVRAYLSKAIPTIN